MKVYSIEISLGINGFISKISESELIMYEKDGICKVRNCEFVETSFPSSDLGKYNTGLLTDVVPRVHVKTTEYDMIQTYVKQMERIITDELMYRLERTKAQLAAIA